MILPSCPVGASAVSGMWWKFASHSFPLVLCKLIYPLNARSASEEAEKAGIANFLHVHNAAGCQDYDI